MKNTRKPLIPTWASVLALVVLVPIVFSLYASPGRTAAPTRELTAPPPAGREEATFAAGCFWSMEAIFKQLKGVEKVVPGYSGGTAPHPSYEFVESGTTGYAESLDVVFDPKVISYRELLQVLLIARDPTSVNRQGNDEGTQYRSVIFYRDAAQQQTAEKAIQEVNASHAWPSPIVTEVQPFKKFYQAEDYHLNYYALHPNEPYCAGVIAPEIAEFRTKFKSELKN